MAISRRNLFGLALAAAATLGVAPTMAAAADYPSRPITLIVPFPAGGGTDTHLRVLSELVSKELGQPVTVENKGGASGTLGPATMAATAKPDGYTLSQMPATVYRLPFIQKTSFDPKTDFTYILQLTGYAFAVAVKADAPWQTWQELLDYAKANPGKVSYSTSGAGGTQHITMEQIAKKLGIKWIHVPYKGGGEQNAALLGGHTTLSAASTGTLGGLADAGNIRLLVMWTPTRLERFPDVPTLREEGIDMVVTSPYGIAGPAGMDPGIVKTLHDAFLKATKDPAHAEIMRKIGFVEDYLGTDDYEKFVMQFIDEQKAMVEELGLSKK